MSKQQYEGSRGLGSPVTLYYIVWGESTTAFDAYTDAEQEVVHNGVTYRPIPVTHGSITSSGTLDKATLAIMTPTDTPLAGRFIGYPPGRVISCTIRQGHAEDPDKEFPVVWTGRIISASYDSDNNQYQLTGEPVSTSMRRPGLRRRYQYGCPHVLYGTSCRASKANATVTTTVTAISGSIITLISGWPGEAQSEKYIGGMIEWTTPVGNKEVRTILRNPDNRSFLVAGRLSGLTEGSQVDVILGCAHTMDECRELHNNILNFGGCPWIPTENPIGTKNNYY